MIIFSNVSKWVGKQAVLDRVNLQLEEGIVHSIVEVDEGNRYSSWFVKLLLGLKEVTSGQIFLDSLLVNEANRGTILPQMGLVTSDLFPQLNGLENICLGLSLSELIQHQTIEQQIVEWMRLLQLRTELLYLYPKTIEDEERPQIGLVRALINDPHYLLFDYPLQGLSDSKKKRILTKWQKSLPLLTQTVVYVTNNLSEALLLGQTVTLLYNGIPVKHGPTQEFMSLAERVEKSDLQSVLKAVYLKSPKTEVYDEIPSHHDL